MKKLDRDKHSSSICQFISDEEKSFITLAPGVNVIKLFFSLIDAVAD
jgi:hypothetical protein